jgi:DNA-binding NarL/FixJ family response regulator
MAAVTPGRATVALIEDEPLVRTALAAAIDQAGYTVVCAATGVEALALFDARAVDLAIIDIGLPGRMDGIATIREARRHHPDLRVIFTSGKPPTPEVSALGAFVMKPARVASVLEAIAQQIGPGEPPKPA